MIKRALTYGTQIQNDQFGFELMNHRIIQEGDFGHVTRSRMLNGYNYYYPGLNRYGHDLGHYFTSVRGGLQSVVFETFSMDFPAH
jgi:hypothetical protein